MICRPQNRAGWQPAPWVSLLTWGGRLPAGKLSLWLLLRSQAAAAVPQARRGRLHSVHLFSPPLFRSRVSQTRKDTHQLVETKWYRSSLCKFLWERSLYLSGLHTTWEEDPNRGRESVSLLCSSLDSYLLCSVLFFVFVPMFTFCPGYHCVVNVQVVDSQNCVERNREHDAGRLPAPAFPHMRVTCLLLGALASTWTARRWSAVCLWLSKLCHWLYLALLGTDSGFYWKHDCTFCLTPSPTAQLGSFVSETKGGRYRWFLLWPFVYDSAWVELGPCGTHWCKETVVVAASWAYVPNIS